MDTLSNETILALNNIAETINTPRPYDWSMLIVSFVSVFFFVTLTWMIYKTNKAQIETQITIQNSTLRLQVRTEFQQLHIVFLRIKSFRKTIYCDLEIAFMGFKIKKLKEKISLLVKEIDDQEYSFYTLLSENEIVKINQIKNDLETIDCTLQYLENGITNKHKEGNSENKDYSFKCKYLFGSLDDRKAEINKACAYYFEGIYTMPGSALTNVVDIFIDRYNEYRLHEITEKRCNINDIL